jgi:hypothetical protein
MCVLLPIAVGNAMSQAIPFSDNQKKSLFIEAVRADIANNDILHTYVPNARTFIAFFQSYFFWFIPQGGCASRCSSL